ncbi:pre-mRNA-splicing factor ATP-dependent RNA helicase [Acrasis kona]|uniref:RNA helicase n=1 Tax=Acrasis kona TaxID=1008807 RepID=A0AAW2ZEC1_9EUKA
MGDVLGWVQDKLHSVIGYSEASVAQYIISIAKKYNDPQRITEELALVQVPNNDTTQKFVAELVSRISNQSNQSNTIKSKPKKQTYDLVSMINDDEIKSTETKKKDKGDKKRKIAHLRKKSDKSVLDDNEPEPEIKRRLVDNTPEPPPQPQESEQDRRDKERQEQDAKLERIREQTKNIEENRGTKKLQDSKNELFEDGGERKQVLSKLRDYSRRRYLGKREEQKIEELIKELEDDEAMWADSELTARELENRQNLRNIIQYARSREDINKIETYVMPDAYYDEELKKSKQDKRFQVLTKRYEEKKNKNKKPEPSEHEKWEKYKIGSATMRFGSRDQQHPDQNEKQYELIVEDEIEFIAEDILKGKMELPEELKKLESTSSTANNEQEDIEKTRKSLPIYPHRERLMKMIADNQVLVIVGETGSGKTTQLTQYLYEDGYTKNNLKIACTQPRRVAAMSVAARVAQEMGVTLGDKVGYSIRFEDCTSPQTIIKYMTDGMMLREFLGEPDLSSYSVIIVDEAHERSLHTDILFGLVKDIAIARPDVKLLISSATIQAEKFSEYFDGAPIINIPGRRYPVDILYTKAPEADYLEASVITVLQVHFTQPQGDILVFLTGQEEIETACDMLRDRVKGFGQKAKELIVTPIYATLPTEMQAEIFKKTPPGARKVVLATNIAETSLTIDGIVYVIDCGFVKQNSYNPRSGMESLLVTPISRASADQRAGRAGRVSPGKCFRLYTSWSYKNELLSAPVPEIQRVNLGNVVLQLKTLGINDLIHFDFMDPPPVETLIAALEQLYALGALNDGGDLTVMGRKMAAFPLDPQMSKMLIASEGYGCSEEVASLCAMLNVNGSVFHRPKERAVHADNARKNFFRPGGDHLMLLAVYKECEENGFDKSWCMQSYVQVKSMKRARDVRNQLIKLMENEGVELKTNNDPALIRKAITAGYFFHAASLQKSGNYRTFHKPQTVYVHPSSSTYQTQARWVIYHELVFTNKEFMRQIIEIEPAWLIDIAPHLYRNTDIEKLTHKMPKNKGRATMA